MILKLSWEDRKKLAGVGLEARRNVEIDEGAYQRHYANWKKSLPLASEDTWRLKAVATCLWKLSGPAPENPKTQQPGFTFMNSRLEESRSVAAEYGKAPARRVVPMPASKWEQRVIIGLLCAILGWLMFAMPAKGSEPVNPEDLSIAGIGPEGGSPPFLGVIADESN